MSFNIQDGTIEKRKRYFAKFYSSTGTFLGTSDDVSFNGFTKTWNGGLGEISLTLARKFDEFSEGDQIDFMNEIQLWVIDNESGASGQKIYSGFIDTYEPFASGGREGVNVKAVGYASRLANIMYKSGTTVTITQNSVDPSDIVKDIVDKYQADNDTSRITYAADSVEDTGSTVSKTFVMKNCRVALDEARKLAPAFWYWYVDVDNVLNFNTKPSIATHTFTFEKDVVSIKVNKNVRDVINQVIIWNGLQEEDEDFLAKSYEDTDSQSEYGKRTVNQTDGRLRNEATMDLWGTALIGERKDPNIKVTVKILDSNVNNDGYDIESINPGDTCKILNLPTTSTTLGTNMVITRVNYTLDSVTLQLEQINQEITQKLKTIIDSFSRQTYDDGISSYTDA